MQLSTAICSLCSIASGACNVPVTVHLEFIDRGDMCNTLGSLVDRQGSSVGGTTAACGMCWHNLQDISEEAQLVSSRKPVLLVQKPCNKQATTHYRDFQSAFRQQGIGIHGDAAACGT
jgi:hypothetical protein